MGYLSKKAIKNNYKLVLSGSSGKVGLNPGTWLQRLERMPPRFGFLPNIYVPFYFLDYFKISAADGAITIDFQRVDKAQPQELDLLQRLLVSHKPRQTQEPPLGRTVVEV